MTNFQPLNSTKQTRNNKLIALLTILAIVGSLCIYHGAPAIQEVSSKFLDLKSSKPKTCHKGFISTPYLSKTEKVWKYTCCPRASNTRCTTSKYGPPMVRKSYKRGHCTYYHCASNCPKLNRPKCRATQYLKSYSNFGCTRYTCCNRRTACPKGYYAKSIPTRTCPRNLCCPPAPRCAPGSYPVRRSGVGCDYYTCKTRGSN